MNCARDVESINSADEKGAEQGEMVGRFVIV